MLSVPKIETSSRKDTRRIYTDTRRNVSKPSNFLKGRWRGKDTDRDSPGYCRNEQNKLVSFLEIHTCRVDMT